MDSISKNPEAPDGYALRTLWLSLSSHSLGRYAQSPTQKYESHWLVGLLRS
jgi:hypothetical protein